MDNLFQSKWFVLVISLVFSVSLYYFVTTETNKSSDAGRLPGFSTDVETLDEVPLQVKMDDEQYVVSGVPDFVRVSLEGKTSELTRLLGNNNYNFFVDLTGLSEGEHTVEVEYDNVPEDLTVLIEPKSVQVEIEKRATAEFPVEVDFVNTDQLPVDYELGEPELSVDKVTVVSSESVIEKIAMVKVYIDVADLRESIRNREVPISVSDIQGNALNVNVDPGVVTVSISVDRPSRKIPLEVVTEGELPEGLTLVDMTAPEEVDVFARNSVLDELEKIETEAIDLSTIEDSTEIEAELQLPDTVRMNDETVTVKFEVEEEKKMTIPIDITNAGDNDVAFQKESDNEVEITVTGSVEQISKLKESDFKAKVDAADLSAGTHALDIEIEGPDDLKLEQSEENVQVEVTEPEEET